MPYPPPPCSHVDGIHAVLCLGGKEQAAARLRRCWDSSQVHCVENGELIKVALNLQQSEPYTTVESTQFWYSFSLVQILYCRGLHTLLNIPKAFLALLRRLFMPDSAAQVSELLSRG